MYLEFDLLQLDATLGIYPNVAVSAIISTNISIIKSHQKFKVLMVL